MRSCLCVWCSRGGAGSASPCFLRRKKQKAFFDDLRKRRAVFPDPQTQKSWFFDDPRKDTQCDLDLKEEPPIWTKDRRTKSQGEHLPSGGPGSRYSTFGRERERPATMCRKAWRSFHRSVQQRSVEQIVNFPVPQIGTGSCPGHRAVDRGRNCGGGPEHSPGAHVDPLSHVFEDSVEVVSLFSQKPKATFDRQQDVELSVPQFVGTPFEVFMKEFLNIPACRSSRKKSSVLGAVLKLSA